MWCMLHAEMNVTLCVVQKHQRQGSAIKFSHAPLVSLLLNWGVTVN